jgi:hypothetical protein
MADLSRRQGNCFDHNGRRYFSCLPWIAELKPTGWPAHLLARTNRAFTAAALYDYLPFSEGRYVATGGLAQWRAVSCNAACSDHRMVTNASDNVWRAVRLPP